VTATRGRELAAALDTAVRDALAFLRTADPDAAAELAELRRREVTRPSVVLVGETKRGKSSLVNALLGVPGLSPVDAAVATSTYLQFVPGPAPAVRAWLPGGAGPVDVDPARLADWATGRGDARPRRVEVAHPAPLLQYVSLLDTPGVGGLDPAHAAVALDAVRRATALLFVADASAPLAQPELDFLVAASERVDAVVFALTKVDAYPGWRRIAEDNQALLRAYAPRFAGAAWYPVSARLAELARGVPAGEQAALAAASRVAELQHALVELAGRGHELELANVLRAARGELARLDAAAAARLAATEADPRETARVKAERAGLAARKRTESRQWTLLLSTETQRARVEAVGLLRTRVAAVQEQFTQRIEHSRGDALAALPEALDAQLQAVAVGLSQDLEAMFRQVGEHVLASVFDAGELAAVLGRLNATLRHALSASPPRDGSGDNLLIALSAGGVAFMAGRGAILGASVLGAGGVVAGGLLVPVAGIGLGLAAGGYVLYRRRVQTDRQQARLWLRDVLAEARAALSDEISNRFTDLHYALSVAVDDAVERRLRELDAHIAEIDAAAAEDQAARARRRARAQADRDAVRARLRQVDEVLARAGRSEGWS
jgi:Dynamin family